MADQTADGRRLRFLTVIDEYTREALRIECARFLNSHDVIRVLEELVETWRDEILSSSDERISIVGLLALVNADPTKDISVGTVQGKDDP